MELVNKMWQESKKNIYFICMLSKSFFLYYFVLSFVENGLVQILITKLNSYSNLLKVRLPQISKEKNVKRFLFYGFLRGMYI